MTLVTGKEHVSFSEYKDYVDCTFGHDLKHIQKINLDEPSVYLSFGTACHASGEDYIETRVMKNEIALDLICQDWKEHDFPEMGLWMKKANRVLDALPDFMDNRFPGWKAIRAEEELYEKIPTKKNFFKGFIDAIIEHDGIIWLIDWKTSIAGWSSYKKRDEILHRQLVFYSLFWSKKHKVDSTKVKCAFITLNHQEYDKNGKKVPPIDMFVPEADNQKKGEAIISLNSMIDRLQPGRKLYGIKRPKSRDPRLMGPCRFCPYNQTKHCP